MEIYSNRMKLKSTHWYSLISSCKTGISFQNSGTFVNYDATTTYGGLDPW
jgi:hypothetical protein